LPSLNEIKSIDSGTFSKGASDISRVKIMEPKYASLFEMKSDSRKLKAKERNKNLIQAIGKQITNHDHNNEISKTIEGNSTIKCHLI